MHRSTPGQHIGGSAAPLRRCPDLADGDETDRFVDEP